MHFRDAATRVLDEPTGKALLAEYSIATTRGAYEQSLRRQVFLIF